MLAIALWTPVSAPFDPAVLERDATLFPRSAAAQLRSGDARLRASNVAGAREAYRKAGALAPGWQAAKDALRSTDEARSSNGFGDWDFEKHLTELRRTSRPP